jgi:hypothetical protein
MTVQNASYRILSHGNTIRQIHNAKLYDWMQLGVGIVMGGSTLNGNALKTSTTCYLALEQKRALLNRQVDGIRLDFKCLAGAVMCSFLLLVA